METFDLEPGGGEPPEVPPPSPLRLLGYAAGAGAVLLAGSLLIGGGNEPADRGLDGDLPTPNISSSPLEVQPIALLDTCRARTDHRNRLVISFRLTNVLEDPVTLTTLQGHPPLGGLRQQGPVRAGGTCRKPAREDPQTVLDPAASRLYTVQWKLPDTCPEPYPLQIRITYQRAGEFVLRSDYLTVLVDLGGIGFAQCPQVVTEFPTP